MANPAAITITELSANGSVNQPTANAIDTTGMVPVNLGGKGLDRVVIEIINAAAAGLTVDVGAGANPPAIQSKALSISMAATGSAGDKKIIGPFEASRFVKGGSDAGELHLTFTPASGSPNATVRCYRLPKFI